MTNTQTNSKSHHKDEHNREHGVKMEVLAVLVHLKRETDVAIPIHIRSVPHFIVDLLNCSIEP